MNRDVRLDKKPERIVSLVPSQTELLHALGLEDKVVGITKFCLHPNEWYRNKPRVGGTKTVNFERVRQLAPDLIIGNKEENERSDIEALMQEYPVWMSDIYNLEDSLDMIRQIGAITETSARAEALIAKIQNEFDVLEQWVATHISKNQKVAYFIWSNPDYCAGTGTFIDAMLKKCRLINYSSDERYPEFKEKEFAPDLIFLSSEPFPFKEKHIAAFQSKFPDAKIVLVDGEMFSWYGSRLLSAPEYFKKLLQEVALN